MGDSATSRVKAEVRFPRIKFRKKGAVGHVIVSTYGFEHARRNDAPAELFSVACHGPIEDETDDNIEWADRGTPTCRGCVRELKKYGVTFPNIR